MPVSVLVSDFRSKRCARLLDHLVRAGDQRRRHVEPERALCTQKLQSKFKRRF